MKGQDVPTSKTRKPPKGTFKDRRAAAKMPQRTVDICLRGDLRSQIEALDSDLVDLMKEQPDRLVGNVAARQLADEIEALRCQMSDETDLFLLRALPRGRPVAPGTELPEGPKTWNELKSLHPPRKDNNTDAIRGVNIDTFSAALVKICTVSPELDDEDWVDLIDNLLTPNQYESLVGTAWALHDEAVDVPLSRAALRIRNSDSE